MDNVIAFNLASCQVKPTKVVENKKYFNEGAYRCQVLSLSNSSQRIGYMGAPYVEFDVVNEQGEYGRAKLGLYVNLIHRNRKNGNLIHCTSF